MVLNPENFLLITSFLLIVSILAGKTSFRFGVPTLLFFIAIGMLAGSEGIGGIQFENLEMARLICTVALSFILFSGGLDTSWRAIRPIAARGITLSTLGVLLTAVTVGGFTYLISGLTFGETGFTIWECMLLGAIVSSTDAAAVFSILRSKRLGLKGFLRPTLEFESGSNDPMAYFLTIACTGMVLNGAGSALSIIPLFVMQMGIGAGIGFGMGKAALWLVNRITLDYEGLYSVLILGLVLFTYSISEFVGGNGFLAVYLVGLVMGNEHFIHKKSIIKFFDGQAWLMQIVLFLTLGLLANPSELVSVGLTGLLISVFLILVARPVSVLLSLIPFRFPLRNKLFISWVGLRGGAPIVFAIYPMIAGVAVGTAIFNIVFVIAVTSVVIQGTSLKWVAKLLHVTIPEGKKRRSPVEIELDESVKSIINEINVSPTSPMVGKRIVDINLPPSVLLVMINRNGKYVTPNGSTVIEPGDVLFALAERAEMIDETEKLFAG